MQFFFTLNYIHCEMFLLHMNKIQLARRVIHFQIDMSKFDNWVMTIADAIAFR